MILPLDPERSQTGLNTYGFDSQDFIRASMVKFFDDCQGKKIRPIGQFADEEIEVPNGPLKGIRYNRDVKPASRLWFNEIESGRWTVHNYTAPTQSGKTLDAFVIPIMWCLFEKEEDVIVGVPDLDRMARSKWEKDIKPVIEASRYAALIPTKGPGSRGGKPNEIKFLNGATMTFMGFGGGDKSRAGETAANLIITESDGADEVGGESQEGTKLDQLMGRVLAYDDSAFIVKECTVTTDIGNIYKSYSDGSAGVLYRPCCHCGKWVSPERDHFIGWDGARSDIAAGEAAKFHCPKCAKSWTDEERLESCKLVKIVHKGQRITDEGEVIGDLPEVTELGFRYSAIDNIFRTSRFLGIKMWKEARKPNREASDKTVRQQEFAEPWRISDDDIDQIDPYVAMRRIGENKRHRVPDGYDIITAGTDLRKRQLHHVTGAWQEDSTLDVIDYGTLKVHSAELGIEQGLLKALRYHRDKNLAKGFPGPSGIQHVDQWWIDANWQSPTVYRFIQECESMPEWEGRVYPYLGRGRSLYRFPNYSQPASINNSVHHIGEEFFFKYDIEFGIQKIFVHADYYKSFLHNRFRIPVLDSDGERMPGSGIMFNKSDGDHLEYFQHLANEYEELVFVINKDGVGGETPQFKTISRVNHFLDASYAMCAAAVYCGVTTTPEVEQLEEEFRKHEEDGSEDLGLIMPDGRMFSY